MNIQDDYPIAKNYPKDHRSVLKEVNTSKEYSINLTTLNREMRNDDIDNSQ